MDIENSERAWRLRADLLAGLAFLVFGILIVYASWTMPRLEARHIHPATVPGLVPGILGFALALCGGLLALKAIRSPAAGGWRALFALVPTRSSARVGAAIALCLVHTLVLVGWLPFWAASAIFIFAFILVFEVALSSEPVPWLRSAVWAAAIAIVASAGIYFVFARIFLVRLP